MASLSSNPSRLRMTACLVGIAGGLVLARLGVRLSAGTAATAVSASWLDRLTLWVEPLLGGLGVLAAIGLWSQRRWGAVAFTIWTVFVAVQVTLIALLLVALAAFAWQPLLVCAGLLVGVLLAGYHLVQAVWRWLAPAA